MSKKKKRKSKKTSVDHSKFWEKFETWKNRQRQGNFKQNLNFSPKPIQNSYKRKIIP